MNTTHHPQSMKYLLKAKEKGDGGGAGREAKLAALDGKITLVEKFVRAGKAVKSNPDETVQLCEQLLATRDVEASVRVGDVFALLVEFYYSTRNHQAAYEVITRMRQVSFVHVAQFYLFCFALFLALLFRSKCCVRCKLFRVYSS
jgi:hypothetical protein